MFTGIVSHVGTVVVKASDKILIGEPDLAARAHAGDSVAVNGICLTVIETLTGRLAFSFMPETAARTTIGSWKEGSKVNLELPVTAAGLFSGHIVQGHVDGIGKVKKIASEGESRTMEIAVPAGLIKYAVEKGSIAVNGVSLTITGTGSDFFSIALIPYTLQHTILGTLREGDEVNIETDILAKYIEQFARTA